MRIILIQTDNLMSDTKISLTKLQKKEGEEEKNEHKTWKSNKLNKK